MTIRKLCTIVSGRNNNKLRICLHSLQKGRIFLWSPPSAVHRIDAWNSPICRYPPSGLRGGVAFALVLSLHSPNKELFVTTTIAMVFFTVFFQVNTLSQQGRPFSSVSNFVNINRWLCIDWNDRQPIRSAARWLVKTFKGGQTRVCQLQQRIPWSFCFQRSMWRNVDIK